MFSVFSDEYFMQQALKEAKQAYDKDEVPVGAVIVVNNKIIAKTHNNVEGLNDHTAHAEILAITAASNYLGSKMLKDCTLYVTLEPCIMCAGALYLTQLSKIVYGAADDKRGFMKYGKNVLHPKTKLEYGVLEDESKALLQAFFQNLRK